MDVMDMWTQRLLDAIGWEDQRLTLPWERVEDPLDIRLPDDYKRLCEAFGHGRFSSTYDLLSVDHELVGDILSDWQVYLRHTPEPGAVDEEDSPYAPYPIYRPGREGLLPWGAGEPGFEFFWLAGAGPPEAWPILARFIECDPGEWDRFDMSVSEFMGRLLLEPGFSFFGVADAIPRPYFVMDMGVEPE